MEAGERGPGTVHDALHVDAELVTAWPGGGRCRCENSWFVFRVRVQEQEARVGSTIRGRAMHLYYQLFET